MIMPHGHLNKSNLQEQESCNLYYMIPNDDSVKENLQAIKDVLNGK